MEKILAKGVGAVLVLASGVAFYYPKYTGAAVMNFQDKMQINTSVFLGLAMFALGMILLFRKK
ncbi:hypothetical protein HY643_00485 [Candidatus Woesearchaeota archaeon]|nr:hypothetical protein [Candidatus Woesearchaeota archaeon]